MPRTLSPTYLSELSRSGAYPGFLISIVTASGGTIYLTTFDRDYTYGGNTYVSCDVSITDLSFDGTISRGASVEFGDQTLAFWAATLHREFDDGAINMWFAYFDVPNEATLVFSGRCGKAVRKVGRDGETLRLSLDAEANTIFAPRQRVQDVIDQTWLVSAGSIIIINDQKWVIDRPKTANN